MSGITADVQSIRYMMKNLGKQIAINTILIVSLVYVVFAAVQTHYRLSHYLLLYFLDPHNGHYRFLENNLYVLVCWFTFINTVLISTILHTYFRKKAVISKTVDFICIMLTYWIFWLIYRDKLQVVFEYIDTGFIAYSGLIINFFAFLIIPPVIYQIIVLSHKSCSKYDLVKLFIATIGLFMNHFMLHKMFLIISGLILVLCLTIRHPMELLNRSDGLRLVLLVFLISGLAPLPFSIMAIYISIIWVVAFCGNMAYLKIPIIKQIVSYMFIPAILYIIIWLIEPYVFKWLGLPAYFSPAWIPL